MTVTQPLPQNLEASPRAARVPGATYRLQFHAGFTFRDARRLVPYLDALGITDVYASPYLKARFGSAHGYDVADPNALNPEVGTEGEYGRFVGALARHDMGQLLDVVPNHMGIGDSSNRWWQDVLENGPSSTYASFFDIDWNPLKPEIQDRDKVVLPILGDQYGRVLENGELILSYRDGAFSLRYYDLVLPIAPNSYTQLLAARLAHLEAALGGDHEHCLELQSIITALTHLPARSVRDPKKIKERNREKEVIKHRIDRLYQDSAAFREMVQLTLQAFNGTQGDGRSFDLLDGLLAEQAYRLAFWRVAAEEINYRRFFDINELAALRMEDPRVFLQTHKLLLELVRAGRVSGLRIDHPDGLWDPEGYLWRLQQHCFIALNAAQDGTALAEDRQLDGEARERELAELYEHVRAEQPESPSLRSMYVVVEKILSGGEGLREGWPVHGTTGYDFLNFLNGIFIERANRRAIDAAYTRFVRSDLRCRDVANSSRKMVMLISLAGEINQLAYQLKRIAAKNRRCRDFTLNGLTFALREIIASLPVYRTYIHPEHGTITSGDEAAVEAAIADAKRRNPRTDPSIFEFVRDTLLLQQVDDASEDDRAEQCRFIARFQQTTGPVMAKGVEDTAFYIYNRLISLNEVGGDPDQFGVSLTAFHRYNSQRSRQRPFELLATSTHDTKRSEDVRARINVLSEMPREWSAALTRWSRLNGRKKPSVDGRSVPERNEEYLLYQTLLGVWPLKPLAAGEYGQFKDRIVSFMTKALREAKVNTSWINPNVAYESAVVSFIEAILEPAKPNPFLDDFAVLQEKVAYFGMLNSLSQTVLKLAAPGVPDIYQGNEIWDFSLVDPDNRRPVDYEVRAHTLRVIQRKTAQQGAPLARIASELLAKMEDGRVKLYVTYRSLATRREQSSLFAQGSYLPLRSFGAKKRHVCAFARLNGEGGVIVAAPVLIAGLTRGALTPPVGDAIWGNSWLAMPGAPGDEYRNIFTGEVLALAAIDGKSGLALSDVFRIFPTAILVRA